MSFRILVVAVALLAYSGNFAISDESRQVLRAVAPAYDEMLYLSRSHGKCVVAVTALPSGEVHNVYVLESIRVDIDPMLRSTAKLWRFEPQEHTTIHRLEFIFRFLPKGTAPEELGFAFLAPTTVEIRRVEPPILHKSDQLR